MYSVQLSVPPPPAFENRRENLEFSTVPPCSQQGGEGRGPGDGRTLCYRTFISHHGMGVGLQIDKADFKLGTVF